MKRSLDSFYDLSLAKCNRKPDDNDDEYDLMKRVHTTYIISESRLRETDVLIVVRVTNNNLFASRICLHAGDMKLYSKCKIDILRYLIQNKRVTNVDSLHSVYVVV
ncbi:hypothetical protein [Phthorimaea operculella granulovirus]|uniref:Uncharacterized protein n=1 Tax=Phthorimaea operculella granulovirus TaxID=192584 RepID=Q8JRY9_9BBAC|nr:hypothetical protein [Phthorimaea operculella granulovirus]AAM70268.1 hypothetical protein [Phthorimaea operculella granulovirus]QBH65905.1 hypothetical protein PhopGVgp070 [Phthorimaea operculella granulovirus]QBH66035.1 hypothetical protein PhopGVgp070 [Phthorimaea operculella granulovirus]QBH66165.1 hypothetical protein PhopGVgp070 [Phthorimaea operculella granulovirus]QBH66295.1 hypothetical protein PhopGVgp070 [Phthorimaea operculella granulovirus]